MSRQIGADDDEYDGAPRHVLFAPPPPIVLPPLSHAQMPWWTMPPSYMMPQQQLPLPQMPTVPGNAVPISPYINTSRRHRVGERMQAVFGDLSTYVPATGAMEVTVNLRNLIGFELREGCVPRSGYPVSACTFTITDGGTDYAISITAQNYTAATLATELQTLIQAVGALSAYTVTYNTNTDGKYIITGDAEFTIDFSASDESEMLNYALGLSHDTFVHTSTSMVVTSTGTVDLQNGKYMQITCPELKNFYGNTDIIRKIHVPDSVNYYSMDTAPIRRFLRPITRVVTLTLYLYVKYPTGKLVPFNNRGHMIDLEFLAVTLVQRRLVEQRIET
jgi:hypothetical protein